MNSPHFLTVIEKIARHRTRQRQEFKAGIVPLDLGHTTPSDDRKLRQLTDSLGKVAEAVADSEAKNSLNTREEKRYALAELAAHCIAWLESEEGK